MSDYQEILDLMGRYTHAYDLDRMHEMGACFTEDAEMTMRIADGDLIGPFEGRDAIVKMMSDTHAGQDDVRRHVLSNVVVDIDGDSARALGYLTLFAVAGGSVQLQTTGTYQDEIVRQDGRWQFSKRHIALDAAY